MSGTRIGGAKAAKMNKQLYGDDFYRKIGSKGGRQKSSKPRGFAAHPELAKTAGAKGGRMSSRKGVANGQGEVKEYYWKDPDEKFAS